MSPADGPDTEAAADRSLDELRERVAVVGTLPVSDRPRVFAEVNAEIVTELEQMGAPSAEVPASTAPDESEPTAG